MSSEKDKVPLSELMTAVFAGLISPAIRLLPRTAAETAGRGAWLSPLLALLPVTLFSLFLWAFAVKKHGDGEGLCALFERCIGKIPGRALSLVFLLWLIFYIGFAARVSAERLLSAVYGNGSAAFFMAVLLLCAAVVASGKLESLTRTAGVYALLLTATVVLVLLAALPDVSIENLWPVLPRDFSSAALGSIPYINILSAAGYYMFLLGRVKPKTQSFSALLRRQWMLLALFWGVTVVTVGALSPGVTAHLQNAFFIMTRNITLFGVVERIESVVVAVWTLSDILYFAGLLFVCRVILADTGILRAGAGACALCGGGALIVGLCVLPAAFTLHDLSERTVPAVHLTLMVIVLPL